MLRTHHPLAALRTDEGTEFDLARQPAAGPFGSTDRYDGADSGLEGGAFERPIGVYRMAYSYVGEASATQPMLHFAPHAAQTALTQVSSSHAVFKRKNSNSNIF